MSSFACTDKMIYPKEHIKHGLRKSKSANHMDLDLILRIKRGKLHILDKKDRFLLYEIWLKGSKDRGEKERREERLREWEIPHELFVQKGLCWRSTGENSTGKTLTAYKRPYLDAAQRYPGQKPGSTNKKGRA